MNLKNKRILITAGPTWVPIDGVRVISNTASGETGLLLAKNLSKFGAKVTLMLGPVPGKAVLPDKSIKIIRYKFFDEFSSGLFEELKNKRYDAVIQSAAVADYGLKRPARHKISSGLKKLTLNLYALPKIIDSIKKADPRLKVIAFKFETSGSRQNLLKQAKRLMQRSNSDLIVANTCASNKYKAYLIDKASIKGPVTSKPVLVVQLSKRIGDLLCKS